MEQVSQILKRNDIIYEIMLQDLTHNVDSTCTEANVRNAEQAGQIASLKNQNRASQ
ncbi:hypothetical protein PITCH_A2170002 [uncultured Desulfobacterium sp.]|uniref:Uncharacterized protein n=1 Tax=uncultured Desulfobacterium sp. TaxID=201089 RepID=A0A445MXK5_9BACT|nr:hypothetical protein PITCH_A2170002 [uncultured Desulfobacterium sp.]